MSTIEPKIMLTSRSLYRLLKSLLYRVIHFTFNRTRRDVNGRLIKQLLADDDLSATVREIRIPGLRPPNFKLGRVGKKILDF